MVRRGVTLVGVLLHSVTALLGLLGLLGSVPAGASGAVVAASLGVTPTVMLVDPNTAPNDLDTPIVITGTDFEAVVSGTEVLTPPAVYVGDVKLQEVGWVSTETLTAAVPWGMDPGVYTVTVVNPGGEAGSLPSAFTVTQAIGVWTTGGPYGGNIYSLDLGEEQFQTVYATVINVGLFRSRDGGGSWEQIFAEIGWENAPEVDPTNPRRIYMAKRSKGLYFSEDGGDTWVALPLPIPGLPPYRLRAFVSPHTGVLFGALTSGSYDSSCEWGCGLFRYDEANQTWQRLVSGDLLTDDVGITAVGFDPLDSQIMYASRQDGVVLKSTDGGQVWFSLGQTPLGYIARLFVNPLTREPWVCGAADGHNGGLYRYNGSDWVQIYASDVSDVVFDPNATDVAHQKVWIASGDGVMVSEDGGEHWVSLSPGMDGVTAIALPPEDPQKIYAGGYGEGVAKTVDGGATWEWVNEGLAGIVPAWLAVNPRDPAVVYGVADSVGLFGSRNGGAAWERLSRSSGGPIFVDPADPEHVINVSGNKVLAAYDGWHFEEVGSVPLPEGMDGQVYVPIANSIVARPGFWLMGVGFWDTRLPYFNQDGGGAVYTSTNGEDWMWVGTVFTYAVTSVGIDPVDPDVCYLATWGGGKEGEGASFFKSGDGGHTWRLSVDGLPVEWNDTLMAIENVFPHRIFLASGGGLYVSYDQGESWENVSLPTEFGPDTPITVLEVLQGDPPILYVGTTIGLFRTMDGGRTWSRASGALGHVETWAIATSTTADRRILYVATIGGMVGRTEVEARIVRGKEVGSGEVIVAAGVYRYATRALNQRVYLPLIWKAYSP